MCSPMGRGEGSLGFDPSAVRTGCVSAHLERYRQEYIVSLSSDFCHKRSKEKNAGKS